MKLSTLTVNSQKAHANSVSKDWIPSVRRNTSIGILIWKISRIGIRMGDKISYG